MPQFIKFPIDWPIHIELNPEMLEKSAHGKHEQQEDCPCDFCHEWFFSGAVEEKKPLEISAELPLLRESQQSSTNKQIEEPWEFPEVDGCKCHRKRCQVHQFKLFWREHQGLVKEHSGLMDDWCITINLDEQLRDLDDLHLRHAQFLNKLRDAGIRQEFRCYGRWCGKANFTSHRGMEFSTLRVNAEPCD
ncbi:5640b22e-73a7-44ce-8584-9c5fd08d4ce7 [Sclerotinia trifoliorum]|uniref:5640b22e-73a7-44ce-8584-9c5fd08d4ce7 n=1 Tax=Sclerotinia trifoliorum TaxID=28548 RepID=A0A8H2VR97_9HELO|nr:5640b22e-73a7-44ce-8584-9c5fd08d4ce7 [Sclerotinia trifoliorum]